MMRRREFIALLCGAAPAWPLAARAQQPLQMRRIGVLMTLAADDPESQLRVGALLQGLQELGWTLGRNLRELLKQLAPRVTRVAIIRDSAGQAGPGQLGALQGAAPSFGVELRPVGTDNAEEIERGMTSFARGPNGGLIVVAGARAQF